MVERKFKTSAFIRKNTKELRDKLRELGYEVSGCDNPNLCIATSALIGGVSFIREDSFDDTNPHTTWNCAGRVDCGYDDEKFLSIVSLK